MAIDPRSWLLVASVLVHGGLAIGVGAVKRPARREVVSVTFRAARAAPRAPEPARTAPAPVAGAPSPATTPAPRAQRAAPRAARALPRVASQPAPPTPAAAAPSNSGSSAPDFGLTLSNGGAGSGLAVNAGSGGGGGDGSARPAQRASARQLEPAREQGCTEEITRARPVEIAQPEYPDAAREAAIEGRVRVEVTIDEQGRVASARVLQALGHGCDEAALAVARAARFEAATRCGRAVRSTLTIGIRFTL